MKFWCIIFFLFFSFAFAQKIDIKKITIDNDICYIFPENWKEKYQNYSLSDFDINRVKKKYQIDKLRDGKWVQYFDSLQIPAKIFYLKNEKKHGEFTAFYPNGKISSKRNYYNDHLINTCVNYYKSGQIKDSTVYFQTKSKNDYVFEQKLFFQSWYENGIIKNIELFDKLGKRNGNWIEYYENGAIKKSINYSNNIKFDDIGNLPNQQGRLKGLYEIYYDNGQSEIQFYYSNNVLVPNNYCFYFPDGKLKECGYFIHNNVNSDKPIRVGAFKEFYNNGKLKSSGNYEKGFFTYCGVIPFIKNYNYKVNEWKYYYDNGKLMASGIYANPEKNIITNCEGGDNIKISQIDENWVAYDKNGNKIKIEKLIEENLLNSSEMLIIE